MFQCNSSLAGVSGCLCHESQLHHIHHTAPCETTQHEFQSTSRNHETLHVSSASLQISSSNLRERVIGCDGMSTSRRSSSSRFGAPVAESGHHSNCTAANHSNRIGTSAVWRTDRDDVTIVMSSVAGKSPREKCTYHLPCSWHSSAHISCAALHLYFPSR